MSPISLADLGIPPVGWSGRNRAIVLMVLEVAGLAVFFLGMLATVYVGVLVVAAMAGVK